MKRKRLALLAICILIMMIGSRCMSKMSKEKTIEDMIACMNAKYSDDSFTYVGITGGGPGIPGFYVVRSEKYPDKPIWASYNETNDTCSDTYLGVKYEDQTRELFNNLMQEAFGKNYYLDYHYSPGTLGFFRQEQANFSFEEYVAREASGIQIYALVNGVPEDGAQTLEKVKKVFSDVSFLGRINFIKESNIVLDESTVDGIIERGDSAVCIDFAKSGSDCYRCEWLIKSIYREELDELIQQRLAPIFGEDCYMEIGRLGSGAFPSIPSFEEYIASPGNGATFSAVVRYNPQNRDELVKLLDDAFSDVVVRGGISFITDPSIALDAETKSRLSSGKLTALGLTLVKPDVDTSNFTWRDK